MEESELMKERLQAITEKHRIQEVIRQKKQELDQEKLKLKHLKKKSLREQWLLDSSYHPPGSTVSEQQIRALLLNIYRIEKEIEALEREESIVSKNESFILERLKAVERSTEDIIKEANGSFVPDPQPIVMDFPQSFSPTTNELLEPGVPPRKTLFAMEINVNRNWRTGESTVLSTSSICPEVLEEQPGLKVYDDGRKSVYALHSLEGSDDQSSVSELSASEVEQLLKSATVHRQRSQRQNNNPHSFCCRHLNHHHSAYSDHLRPSHQEEELSWRTSDLQERKSDHQWGTSDSQERSSCNGNNQNRRNLRDIQRVTSFRLPQNNNRCTSQQIRRHQSFHSNGHRSYCNNYANYATHANHPNDLNRSNRCPSPQAHGRDAVMPTHRLSYTPASDISLSDYISVDEQEELFHYRPSPRTSPAPSPVFGEDTPFTILNAMETGEPITAIFMGFQPARDDSGQGQEFEGALKAELVVIDDDYGKTDSRQEAEVVMNGNTGWVKEQQNGGRFGTGMRKIREKGCCTLS